MKPRSKRLLIILAGLAGVSAASALVLETTMNVLRARAPGRPKPGSVPPGARLRYSADEGSS